MNLIVVQFGDKDLNYKIFREEFLRFFIFYEFCK